MALQNKCQLIVYPDSMGSNIAELHYLANRYFSDCIAGIHLLPFYPSSADRGFAPITYDAVEAAFGTWHDVDRLGEEYDLVVDFMVNHISAQSAYFKDFLEKGDKSEYADLFLRLDKMGPNGITDEDLRKVYTRKPRPPYREVSLADGKIEKVWCTFDYEQIDLNVNSPIGRKILRELLIKLARHRIKMIRCDAFGYTIKKLGTNCFYVEPETSDLLNDIRDTVKPFDVEILPEIHEHHSIQLKLGGQGHWVYDFALPLLVLQALYDGNNKNLINWLNICPRKQITTLDTHDGLPVVDVVDLMTEEEIERTRENLYTKGANVQKRYSTDPEYKNLDVYQINCTYYSALGDRDDSYILARAIQFFSPGIPQVYYVGLLAGRNDIELLESTKHGRDINRHNYSIEEVEAEIKRPVVQKLMKLMKFRNECVAFDGEMKIHSSAPSMIVIEWTKGDSRAILRGDLERHTTVIEYRDVSTRGRWMTLEL